MTYERFLKKLGDFKLEDEETKAKINRKCSKKSLYFKYNGDPSKSKVIRRYEKVSDLGFMYYTFGLEIKKKKKKSGKGITRGISSNHTIEFKLVY